MDLSILFELLAVGKAGKWAAELALGSPDRLERIEAKVDACLYLSLIAILVAADPEAKANRELFECVRTIAEQVKRWRAEDGPQSSPS